MVNNLDNSVHVAGHYLKHMNPTIPPGHVEGRPPPAYSSTMQGLNIFNPYTILVWFDSPINTAWAKPSSTDNDPFGAAVHDPAAFTEPEKIAHVREDLFPTPTNHLLRR